MRFRDRLEAADRLAEKLLDHARERPLVLGIPRGAVPMARRLAERLGGDLDVVLVHKIGAPEDPEFAIGSISEFGSVYQTTILPGLPRHKLDDMARLEIEKLRQRRRSYSPVRPPIPPRGRTVIVVDDGIATGSTMLAALRAVREQRPARLIAAAPIASRQAAQALAAESDAVVVLDCPGDFFSISQFYDSFPQVDDEEVLRLLAAPV